MANQLMVKRVLQDASQNLYHYCLEMQADRTYNGQESLVMLNEKGISESCDELARYIRAFSKAYNEFSLGRDKVLGGHIAPIASIRKRELQNVQSWAELANVARCIMDRMNATPWLHPYEGLIDLQ